MATLLQLRRMVRNRLGVSANDAFFRDDKLDDAINNAIATLEQERNWPWQERYATLTTTITPGEITLPDDWRATRAVWYDGYELDFVPAYDVLRIPTTRSGTPTIYGIVNNKLHIRSVPATGTELTMLYDRQATLLEADSDEPELPQNAYPAIVAKAAQLCSTREDDRPSAQSHMIEYAQWVERLTMTTSKQKRGVGRKIRAGNWV